MAQQISPNLLAGSNINTPVVMMLFGTPLTPRETSKGLTTRWRPCLIYPSIGEEKLVIIDVQLMPHGVQGIVPI